MASFQQEGNAPLGLPQDPIWRYLIPTLEINSQNGRKTEPKDSTAFCPAPIILLDMATRQAGHGFYTNAVFTRRVC